MKRILITGGCGYLGSILANFLNKKEFKIYVLDNLSNSSKKFLDKNITFYRLDLNIKKHITSIFKKNNFDTIIHLAAKKSVIESQKKPHLYFKENSENSLILFKIAKKYKVKNFIFISSAAVYGNYSKKIVTKTLTKPISVYGKSKLKAEKMLIKNSSSKIKLVVLRLFNLAGADIDNLIGNNSRLSKDVFCYLIDSFEKKKNI